MELRLDVTSSISLTPGEAAGVLAGHARDLELRLDRRVVLGLAGGPGVGKSTIAAEVVARLNRGRPGCAALVPMDGFHMRHAKLEQLGIAAAKGAPHTFEAAAFAGFLARLRRATGPVSGPGYSRAIEDVLEDAFTVAPEARILIVEGNYLLLPDPPWDGIRRLLDLAIFLELPRDTVRARLLRRHAEHGLFTEERNAAHVDGVDLPNYDLVGSTRDRADLAIDLLTDT